MRYASSRRGYTLLELIVSVGIFSLVMLAATGAYFTLIDLDRRARGVNDIVTNLSFAVDSMSRAIRTGTGYMCNNSSGSPNCPSGSGAGQIKFGFTDSSTPTRSITYSLVNNQVVETVDGVSYPITDPAIAVQTLTFYVRGVTVESGTEIQPQATFIIRGTINVGHGKTVDFDVEGGGTQRLLELI